MTWSPALYSRFEDDRTRPVRDLAAAIPEPPRKARVVDLGCGPGNSTEVLAARFPGASVTGLDSSEPMIAAARKRLPAIEFSVGDIADWPGGADYDVILSNAALQWLPDHERLLPRLLGRLAPGGTLAVQMPNNLDEPAYRIMRDVAASPPWEGRLASAGGKRGEMLSAAEYYALLQPCCRRVDVWQTTYMHVLDGPDAVVDWFKGSGLRPYLAALAQAEQADFLARYRDEIARAYPELANGTVLLPFPRLFLVATLT